jgi:hypothetical protein
MLSVGDIPGNIHRRNSATEAGFELSIFPQKPRLVEIIRGGFQSAAVKFDKSETNYEVSPSQPAGFFWT